MQRIPLPRWLLASLNVIVLIVALPPAPARAASVFYVGSTNGGSTTTSCATPANTTCTLQGALSLIASGDTVRFGVGFPNGGVIDVRTGSSGGVGITLSTNVTIDGNGRNPFLDGGLLAMAGNSVQVLRVTVGVIATLTALTIRNGTSNTFGGGIENDGTLTLTNSTVSGNYATYYGGGIVNQGNLLTITNSTISGNKALSSGGGGIYTSAGNVTVTNSTISGNLSQNSSGGGIYDHGATLSLINSAITGNTSTGTAGAGGGIYRQATDTATITDSTISGNTAGGYGGGIEITTGRTTLTNSTVSGNTTQNRDGGGIDHVSGILTITNSTVVNNGAPDGRIGGISDSSSGATFTNSIDAYNGTTPSSSIPSDSSIVAATVAGFDTTLRDNGGPTLTHAITTASPAYGSGNLTACQAIAVPNAGAIDQRGAPRVIGSGGSATCSIGAFEPGLVRSVTTLTVSPSSPVPAGRLVTLAARTDGIIGGSPADSSTTFADGATTLGSRSNNGSPVTFTTATLGVGTHSLTAQYVGGSIYAVSASPAQPLTVQPRVDAISPGSGDVRGGALVTISGAGFVPGGTTVQFDTSTATVETTTPTLLTLRTPPHTAAIVRVTVTVNGQATTQIGAYTYGIVAPAPAPLRPSPLPITAAPTLAPAQHTSGTPVGMGMPTPAPAPTRHSG